MAESNDSWWGSWYNTAKSKSAEVFEAVRKDLGEISTVVKEEASAASNAISQTLKLDEPDSTANQVKKSFSAFLGQVGTVLNPAPEDDETEAILITSGNGSVLLTGLQKHLLELQSKDSTYLTPPEPALKTQYKRWEDVILEDQLTQDRLARHLASSTVLNEKYITLVPEKVGHHDFWMRYLFRKALLEDGLAQAKAAERKAKMTEIPTAVPEEPTVTQPKVAGGKAITHSKSNSELSSRASALSLHDEISQTQSIQSSESTPSFSSLGFTSDATEEAVRWDLEEFPCDVELSEEQQNKLLQEYEKEMQERTITKEIKKIEPKANSKGNKKNAPTVDINTKLGKNTGASKQNSKTKNTSSNKTVKGKEAKPNEIKLSESKSDMALSIESDHFKKDNQEVKKKVSKDSVDSSSKSCDNGSNNSDESWEKEFEDLDE